MNTKDSNVFIIGGGITGLGCAHYLKKYAVSSVLFERESFIGGKACYLYDGGRCLEFGGKNFSQSWPLFTGLLKEFNIKDFSTQHTRNHILMKNRIVRFTRKLTLPESIPMIYQLGLRNLLQLKQTLDIVKAHRQEISFESDFIKKIENDYDDKPITSYFDKRITHSLFRMSSIIMGGAEPEETYYSTLMHLIKAAAGDNKYAAVTGGIGRLFNRLSSGLDIRFKSRITTIQIANNTVQGLTVSEGIKTRVVPARHVIASVPLHVLRTLIHFPSALNRELDSIHYFPVAVVIARYDNDVFDRNMNSLMFDNRFHLGHCAANRLDEKNVVRYTLAGRNARRVMGLSDEALVALVEKEFSSVRPIAAKRISCHVKRHAGGICAYGPRYSSVKKKLMDYISNINGLEIAGDYLEGHQLEQCLVSAEKAVVRMTQSISQQDEAKTKRGFGIDQSGGWIIK